MLTAKELNAALKELYDVVLGLDGKDLAHYHLFCRYQEKLSPAGLQRLRDLEAKGRAAGPKKFAALVYSHNPFLALVKKDMSGAFAPIPTPLIFGKEED